MRNPIANHVGSRGSDISPNVRSSASCAADKTNARPIIIRTTTQDSGDAHSCNQTGNGNQTGKGVQGEHLFQQLARLDSLKRNSEGEGEGLALIEGMSASQQALELRKARDEIYFRKEMKGLASSRKGKPPPDGVGGGG